MTCPTVTDLFGVVHVDSAAELVSADGAFERLAHHAALEHDTPAGGGEGRGTVSRRDTTVTTDQVPRYSNNWPREGGETCLHTQHGIVAA